MVMTDSLTTGPAEMLPGNTLMFSGNNRYLMDAHKTLYITNRKDWRAWLEKNFENKKEIWLVYPEKSSGKSRILYNDAVEEALCFGWIDSRVKTLDDNHSAQRFSPRDPKSMFSQANKERLQWLLEKNMIHPSLLNTVRETLNEKFIFPPDILAAIKNDREAWKNYQNFTPSYQRIRIAYIDGARKRPAEFEKRLRNFIRKTRENKEIGFGGIEKYYLTR
jgi:uncharacterized protein YdeI (YjbR/CyaY-like superfamily)